jgi:hypothetical protein
MKKGGVARVDLLARTPLRGVLMWILTPHMMELIGN